MFSHRDEANSDDDVSVCDECIYFVLKRVIPEGHKLLRPGELGTCVQARRRLTVYADDPACSKARR